MKLVIDRVSKRYGSGPPVLRQFSLELGTGVLGLLGPNGAGKTTLMSILATITTRATEGSVSWALPQRPVVRRPMRFRLWR